MRPKTLMLGLAALVASALAGCGGSDRPTAGSTATATSASAAGADKDLGGVCPSTIVVQTPWNPEADHSELYELAAADGTIDAARKRYTADLVSEGQKTGVKIEIRAGGPATGFQSPTQQMYADEDIYMGHVSTDDSIRNSIRMPMVAVVAPRENWAGVLNFDPATYDFKTIADVGKEGATVLYFRGSSYMDYLVNADILKKAQVDSSYDGKPARFVTSAGKLVQQGFITAEPWQYEHQIKPWSKPLASLKISDAGYPNYGETLAVRKRDLAADAPCLKKLVPMLQQAQVDYAKDSARANALIVRLVERYKTGWVYPRALADYAAKVQVDEGIISNGGDATLGSFDEARIAKMLNILRPIYNKANIELKAGLQPSDVFTNDFIVGGIGL